MPLPRVDNFAGVPLLYDRKIAGHYGKTGVPFRPFIQQRFADQCETAFTDLFNLFRQKGVGPVKAILSGGVGRSGSGSSYHHKNRAFDLDGLVMDDGNWVADTFPRRPLLYLAIESVLRKQFGTVLAYDYNKAHEDHFHFDNGRGPGFKTMAKSHVIYLQNVIFFVYDVPIGRDGVWGPQTSGAATQVRNLLGIGPFSKLANWIEFLDVAASDAIDKELAIPAIPAPVD